MTGGVSLTALGGSARGRTEKEKKKGVWGGRCIGTWIAFENKDKCVILFSG